MFEFEYVSLKDNDEIEVGLEVRLTGEIRRGISNSKTGELESVVKNIEEKTKEMLVIIDVRELQRWDSLGVFAILNQVVNDINPSLISSQKTPVSVIGLKDTDVFWAAKDKYPDCGEAILPWYSSVEEFLKVAT